MSNQSILRQLQKLKIENLELNGHSVAAELRRHAHILADCIMYELDKMYDSYKPKVYKRTYALYDALYVDSAPILEIHHHGAEISIKLHFDDGAIHPNVLGGQTDVVGLINDGYKTDGRNIPMFSERPGAHFIEKGIQGYKNKVKSPFPVIVTKNGKEQVF